MVIGLGRQLAQRRRLGLPMLRAERTDWTARELPNLRKADWRLEYPNLTAANGGVLRYSTGGVIFIYRRDSRIHSSSDDIVYTDHTRYATRTTSRTIETAKKCLFLLIRKL